MSSGKEGCRCTNETNILASLSQQRCQLLNGESGIKLTLGGSCVPFHYGSSECLQHDRLYDKTTCYVDENGKGIVPAHCFRPWCYVDPKQCARDSDERVFRSTYFPVEKKDNIFYSYSTCNSTADEWLSLQDSDIGSHLGGVSIKAAIPTYQYPMLYKRNSSDIILRSPGVEYYNNDVQYEGVYMDYAERINFISNGDIQDIMYTYKSRASGNMYPTSSYTAAVQDVADGLVDMAVGPFWITGERLKMTAFTIPFVTDKTFLVIPNPGTSEAPSEQMRKVTAPFSDALWGLILGIIALAALLSVWFSDRADVIKSPDRRDGLIQLKKPKRRRKMAYVRLACDAFLQKGTYFFSAGVDQDPGASLPHKILMFGFACFILISVSAYVANLAAFLTRRIGNSITTMEGAVAAGVKICAHPILQGEMRRAWPSGNFYFSQKGTEFHGMIEDYDEGKCKFLMIGWEDTSMDTDFIAKLCARNLVYTSSVVTEIPMGFPIRSQLSSGFSYWMYEGSKYHDITIPDTKVTFSADNGLGLDICDVRLSFGDMESNSDAQITVENLFFPLLFFLVCAFVAVVLQLIHHFNIQTGHASNLVGRVSALNMTTGSRKKANNSAFTRRSEKLGGSYRRKASGSGSDPESDNQKENEEELDFGKLDQEDFDENGKPPTAGSVRDEPPRQSRPIRPRIPFGGSNGNDYSPALTESRRKSRSKSDSCTRDEESDNSAYDEFVDYIRTK